MSRCERCGAKDHTTAWHDAATRRYLAPSQPALLVESLLPFELCTGASGRYLQALLQKPFQPLGLMLWDVGELMIEAALVGRDLALVAGFGKVPARWFATQQSFDAVMRAQSAGDAAAWGHWPCAYPGQTIRLVFDGAAERVQALMWGYT